ncbi:transposase [Dactylosporangium sp. NBC_01737]|uniref:transposase n=1 Tax=Dactylosporangium sp. NBC_01737 TaxID=2975959 RepID=UPI002E1650C6|nr:transposase [Dactylosporangium sp. NBC_01737]
MRKTIPGWPFSFAAGLEWGASSWTALLDAVRVGPDDDATVVSVTQIGAVVARLAAAGRPAPVFVFDAGYDLTRITYLAADHGVQVLGRVRSDRVFYAPAPKRLRDGRPGRPRIHGNRFELSKPVSLPSAEEQLSADSPRYGAVVVSAWHGLHQRLSKQSGWAGFVGPVPVVPGTVIRIQVERLPGDRAAPPGAVFDLDLLWKTYLRRFDLEHTFRLLKQVRDSVSSAASKSPLMASSRTAAGPTHRRAIA